jgi:transcriptional regulator with XRE-family HTH domain
MGDIMDKSTIGKRVRRQRESLNLTRDQFAEQIDISPQFLAEIENGKKGMSAETLYKICEKGKASADYILFGKQILGEVKTPAIETLSKIPSQFSEEVEDLLLNLLRTIEKANNNK